jgi:uncharacterized protein GlcG (DUF336 family)
MGLFARLRRRSAPRETRLRLERLERREVPTVSASLTDGTLAITGDNSNNRILVSNDAATGELVVTDYGQEVGRFSSASVSEMTINTGDGNDWVRVMGDVTQPVTIQVGAGNDVFAAGGGPAVLVGGSGRNKLFGGQSSSVLTGGPGRNLLVGGAGANTFAGNGSYNVLLQVKSTDSVVTTGTDVIQPVVQQQDDPAPTLTAADVEQLLERAAAASSSNDAIIAIVDRNGRILGVRVESGVDPAILNDNEKLVFSVDGAVSLARTAAFFSSNQAPLTSRTVRFISQSTITQREVESDPNITDPNSTVAGPGFVAPVGLGGHFPPGVSFTPAVDLFGIENTNRDSIINNGPDGIRGTADDVTMSERFNINPAYVPSGKTLFAPESYGFVSGLDPSAQSRGIATLPGGIPIYLNGSLVGGIGVFFPGKTGYATEENSALSATYDSSKPDRSLEAEYMAFAAVGGSPGAGFSIGTLAGIDPVPGISLPFGRIDLVGVTLDIYGPGGLQGPQTLVEYGQTLGTGDPNSGRDLPVTTSSTVFTQDSMPVPDGWLVTPHDGVNVTAADVQQIIEAGIQQAVQTRAAIRLPLGSTTRMVFAVTDETGEVLGLYRMPDATVFSIDVAVAKARNVAYYDNASQLQAIDQVPGIAPGTAFTNRTFRYLAQPRFPEGIDGDPPGPFSILNDGGASLTDGTQVGAPLPASAYQSALGYDAFHPQTNFHDPYNTLNQNGVVFFPGSAPLYKDLGSGTPELIGGFGVSGDGVDQDDVVTGGGQANYYVPSSVNRADQVFFNGVRLPYQKHDRNPTEL